MNQPITNILSQFQTSPSLTTAQTLYQWLDTHAQEHPTIANAIRNALVQYAFQLLSNALTIEQSTFVSRVFRNQFDHQNGIIMNLNTISIDDSDSDSDNNESGRAQDTLTVMNAIRNHSDDQVDATFSRLFQKKVTCENSNFAEMSGRIESYVYEVRLRFGERNVTKQWIIDFDASTEFDPIEEGSSGDFSASTTILDVDGTVLLDDSPLFSNIEDVDYLLGYGGVSVDSNTLREIKRIFNVDVEGLQDVWDLMCISIPVFEQGSYDKWVSAIMKNVREEELNVNTTTTRPQHNNQTNQIPDLSRGTSTAHIQQLLQQHNSLILSARTARQPTNSRYRGHPYL